MLRLVLQYLLPFYLAIVIYNLASPRPNWDLLWHFSWVAALVVASIWSFARSSPSIAEKLAPHTVDCPQCLETNPVDRVLCASCLSELYMLNDEGELESISKSSGGSIEKRQQQ